ncbi:GNAT family N-acetyltransferase [Aureisphaera galaxeae]|uniref:GNAT family N-acetyltransferase n=1 Tax=Aureisphaera galaxeae TaxID=1538023 RepID=UPI002350BDEC|nr:GNAT family N-acetyltransferase [Aureisphaera galaxeae]MDC8004333.1 GNAT family N-acetyltransferase [Aureisphaera galaxeae]
MKIKSLDTLPFASLMDCFLVAFANYFVKMPTDHDFYEERWRRAKVSYADSYGMFDGDTLIGFIIHAIDTRNGDRIAFNTGTGVIPEYRGKRIVQQLYDHCIPKLKEKGISLCALEVITENEKAVKAYEKVGFSITKRYKCYGGTFQVGAEQHDYVLKNVDASHFLWETLHQESYSWDNHIETVQRGSYDYYVINSNGKEAAYFILEPNRCYVAQFDVFEDTLQNWERLFSAIQGISEEIRINNVDEQLTSKINFLKHIQLKNTVDQFEMEMRL